MNKYNTWMSIERNQRSPSFRSRQRTAKVNQHSKLLPNDFFPKTLSQSPKKRNEPPTSAEVLAEWYQREQSADKPKKEFHRLAYNRPSMSRVSLCQDKEQTPIEKQRYVMDYYHKMKDHIKTKAQPGNPPCIFSLKKIEENTQKNIIPLQQKKDQPKVRLIRSQSRPKRNNQTPQSCSKRILITRRSVQKLNKIKQGPVAMAFDGTVTFSRFK